MKEGYGVAGAGAPTEGTTCKANIQRTFNVASGSVVPGGEAAPVERGGFLPVVR